MKLLRLVVLMIATQSSVVACSTDSNFRILSDDGEFVDYAGTATVNGVYFLDPNNIETNDLVCFLPDALGQKSLPQDSVNNQFHWMCFSNSVEAKILLELTSLQDMDSTCYKGSASITMKDYHRYIAESEGISRTELVNVFRHSVASAVPCGTLHSP